ncbi:hypothetical protein P171DRAFT_23781 [Karstenula rhodostoma CBS 690.94]|uniref:Alpha/beta-hydrolase n=1 Tax=Karstenula rhodostoma CBS 690.94 TaxID=1392251 RepID=A0A9P4PIM1_9PLEO|nr:hypothetical protein P171DRAFT_23781 [Karstenula rhodostoma CBS 690.94]
MRYSTLVVEVALGVGLGVFASPTLPGYDRRYATRPPRSPVQGLGQLKASAGLTWTSCFDQFQCTVMTVPLDYDDPSVGTVNIQFIKSPAKKQEGYTQDILFNPGGPGASGVSVMLDDIDAIRQTLGLEHNIVSFDPRGVGYSGPDLSCFAGPSDDDYMDFLSPIDIHNNETLRWTWDRAGAFGDQCTQAERGRNFTARYVNTVATASDVLQYTEWLAKSKGEDPLTSELWYYGASYGATLGAVFADRHPRRVGRLVLDGVQDADDYFQGKWIDSIADADRVFETFFSYCQQAGHFHCKFWDRSVSRIKDRFHAIEAKLATSPILTGGYIYVDAEELKYLLVIAIDDPQRYFPELAYLLWGLEQASEGFTREEHEIRLLEERYSQTMSKWSEDEARLLIGCTDADGRLNLSSFDAFVTHANTVYNTSKYLGEYWASDATVCSHISIRAPPSQVVNPDRLGANRTSNPILFLSTSLDPKTSIQGARNMAKKFGGSRLLEQKGIGHTVLYDSSSCTRAMVKNYLKDASLPPEGTVCAGDRNPFTGSSMRRGDLVDIADMPVPFF